MTQAWQGYLSNTSWSPHQQAQGSPSWNIYGLQVLAQAEIFLCSSWITRCDPLSWIFLWTWGRVWYLRDPWLRRPPGWLFPRIGCSAGKLWLFLDPALMVCHLCPVGCFRDCLWDHWVGKYVGVRSRGIWKITVSALVCYLPLPMDTKTCHTVYYLFFYPRCSGAELHPSFENYLSFSLFQRHKDKWRENEREGWREKRRKGERKKYSICRFTSQMPTVARARWTGARSQELPVLPRRWQGPESAASKGVQNQKAGSKAE